MIDRDIFLLLTGAGIALISSVVTALINHWLTLRMDMIRRERDEMDRMRTSLMEGTHQITTVKKIARTSGVNAQRITTEDLDLPSFLRRGMVGNEPKAEEAPEKMPESKQSKSE